MKVKLFAKQHSKALIATAVIVLIIIITAAYYEHRNNTRKTLSMVTTAIFNTLSKNSWNICTLKEISTPAYAAKIDQDNDYASKLITSGLQLGPLKSAIQIEQFQPATINGQDNYFLNAYADFNSGKAVIALQLQHSGSWKVANIRFISSNKQPQHQ